MYYSEFVDITRCVEILAIITFFVLLISSLYCLNAMYLCDNQTCKAFEDAANKGAPGSKEYTVDLLSSLFTEGIWFMPFIGSAIATPLSLWFMQIPITVVNFAILFFVIFVTIYCILGFIIHHYVDPIRDYVVDYINTH